MLLLWVLLFDFQRILFSIHNFHKVHEIGFVHWLGTFFYSLRLDLATAGFLSIIPGIFLLIAGVWQKRWAQLTFSIVLIFEIIVVSLIHAGEINAYPEWNHKLTGRVFMHLSNPDEVVRTADYGMMFWFFFYGLLEIAFGVFLHKKFFRRKIEIQLEQQTILVRIASSIVLIPTISFSLLLAARGGWQQIPINTDAAIYSTNYVANDISINSTYFFGKSFLLYKRANIDEFIPEISDADAEAIKNKLFTYPFEHDNWILENKRPNIVVIVLESWTGNAMGCMTDTRTASPNFDRLTKEGVFFSNVYGVAGTSEIGNSAIFSGFPGIPEISITMQADKHRKIPCLNQDLKEWGYHSSYLFSGDLKYGNIGGYFTDHGFDEVEDEADFPKSLPKGKLNYYDEDLFDILLNKINNRPEPFMQCAFTGSTHSPYDFPNPAKFKQFSGVEGTFHNSMLYADSCINDFLNKAKKQPWYENTLFVFVADHGHASNEVQNPSSSAYHRIPVLFYGEPIKQEWRGKRIEKLGSQVDIVRTLLYQMEGDYQRYVWSKDLLNPNAPEFALHTINRGYGWVTPSGNFTYQMENKQYIENNYPNKLFNAELQTCQKLLSLIYREYKQL